jgi:ribosomal silencing factor RsfS
MKMSADTDLDIEDRMRLELHAQSKLLAEMINYRGFSQRQLKAVKRRIDKVIAAAEAGIPQPGRAWDPALAPARASAANAEGEGK